MKRAAELQGITDINQATHFLYCTTSAHLSASLHVQLLLLVWPKRKRLDPSNMMQFVDNSFLFPLIAQGDKIKMHVLHLIDGKVGGGYTCQALSNVPGTRESVRAAARGTQENPNDAANDSSRSSTG